MGPEIGSAYTNLYRLTKLLARRDASSSFNSILNLARYNFLYSSIASLGNIVVVRYPFIIRDILISFNLFFLVFLSELGDILYGFLRSRQTLSTTK